MTGAVIGARYRLVRLLGKGGMGTVWAADDALTGQVVALKLMNDATDPVARRRFLREARSASSVRHPHVVTILDVIDGRGMSPAGSAAEWQRGSIDGRGMSPAGSAPDELPAIVMELLEGESLRARLACVQRIALPALANILVPVMSAVGEAHAHGIVHRDLKPENIFLAGDAGAPLVKVLDFGIATSTVLDDEAMRSTGLTTGVILGTPAYMAPEQVFAEKDLDHRADIWALGVVLYECLSGTCPTAGENVGQVLKHVVARPFAPLEQLVDVPDPIARLVARMLARERARRPADLREVLEVLAPFATTQVPRFGAPPRSSASDAIAETLDSGAAGDGVGPLARTLLQATPEPSVGDAPIERRPAPRFVVAGAVAAVLAVAAVAAYRAGWWTSPPLEAVASPLADPVAKLACPILRADGVDPPAGWLGAAAAAVACERARVVLGGRSDRVVTPAELLGLPRGPTDAFPLDPYGQDGARERSVAAARQRAQAYLDGAVTWHAEQLTVALSLRSAEGTLLASAVGSDRGLYAAVRAAMAALVGPARIPRARALVPEVAAWQRTDDVDAALALVDVTFAFAHNAGGLADECRRFEAASARLGELGVEGRWLCAYTLGQPLPTVALATTEATPVERAIRIRINYVVHKQVAPGDAALLRRVFEGETTPRGRALAAATESCLLSAGDPQARGRAILAVQSEPNNPEGGLCNPWEQLMTLESDAVASEGAVRAMQGWVPWSSYAWFEPGFRSVGKDPAALPLLWRAYRLSPFDVQIAGTLAQHLLVAGDRAAARGVAADLRSRGQPIHELESDLILVSVESSEARLAGALRRAMAAAVPSRADAGWIRAQRFEVAWRAFELAEVLGRAREIADVLVERFLDPEPSPLDGNSTTIPMRIPAICARSSGPMRCLARFRALHAQVFATVTTEDTDAFLAGVEYYVQGNFVAAARAWAPLLAGSMMLASTLPDAMVDAFERTGAPELAAQIDLEVMKRASELNGATLAHARVARRVLARGDRRRARQLAEQVVEAWGHADGEPPALAEMRQLLARLPPAAAAP